MPRIHVCYMTCLLIAAPAAQAANIRLQLEGLNGELQKNVRARLSTIDTDEVTADGRFRARVKKAIEEGLRALGYYEPDIDFESRPAPARGGRPVLIARVAPGEPVKIAGSTIILRGDARNDADYQQWVKEGRPTNGTILNHGK